MSNVEIDKEWFNHLYGQGYTLEELAGKDCVWMTPDEIGELIGVES